MDIILTENVKVLILWLACVKYVRKGSQGDHNIQSQRNCNHQEDQRTPFHTQVARETFCPLQYSEWPLMDSFKLNHPMI